MAFGLIPYSNVSYNMISSSLLPNREQTEAEYQYKGNGGINQVFLSNGWQIIPKFLSVGIRAGYVFGKIEDETIINLEEVIYEDEDDTVGLSKPFLPSRYYRSSQYSDLLFEGGINLRKEFGKNLEASLGFIYEFGANINTSRNELVDIYNEDDPDTPTDDVLSNEKGSTYLPPRYGIGLSITKAYRWTFGLDYYTRDWSQFKTDFGSQGNLIKNYKIIIFNLS